MASLRTASENSSILWRLYCERSFGPLPALPMSQPGLNSSVVNRGGSPATESGHGFGGIVRTRNSRNGGLTSTANVVGNRLANYVNPSSGGPMYRPFSIRLKDSVIRFEVATTCMKSEFGFPNSISNSCSIVLLANVLLKWSIGKKSTRFPSPGSFLSFAVVDPVSVNEAVWLFFTGDPASVEEIRFFGSIMVRPDKHFRGEDGRSLLLGLFGAFDKFGEYCRTVWTDIFESLLEWIVVMARRIQLLVSTAFTS